MFQPFNILKKYQEGHQSLKRKSRTFITFLWRRSFKRKTDYLDWEMRIKGKKFIVR